MMFDITVALDWTPNTNHTGFYVAQAQGWYAAAGLNVRLVSADEDNYAVTPAKKVATGAATFGIAPSESVISYHTLPDHPRLVAVAALLQHDTSAIVTLGGSGITRPAMLDGTRYASYKARFEGTIVRRMIQNDGGAGTFEEIFPPKLGIWETLLQGEADATWVFMPWEGVEAERKGIPLNAFRMDDYGIPYGYTPILLAHPDSIAQHPDALRAFMAATAAGYQHAAREPAHAAELLMAAAQHPALSDSALVQHSQRVIAPAYCTAAGQWGVMHTDRWATFLDWLSEQGVLLDTDGHPIARDALHATDLFTTALLPGATP